MLCLTKEICIVRAVVQRARLVPSASPSLAFYSYGSVLHTAVYVKGLFLTLFPHSHLEALFQPAVLALVAVVLVDWTVAGATALVGQIASNRSFEKALAT